MTEAIILVNNATDTAWCQSLLVSLTACMLGKRLAFWRHDHTDVGARQGQIVFYYGPNENRFEKIFSQYGTIMRATE
jgi:hypothetical protein